MESDLSDLDLLLTSYRLLEWGIDEPAPVTRIESHWQRRP